MDKRLQDPGQRRAVSREPGVDPGGGTIPLSVPTLRGHEWNYVKECLDTGWVSSVGGYVDRFERELAAFVGRRHAVATVNGTSALHVALLVAGVQPQDEVLVSGLTFIAPANAVRYVGAWPVFIDAEPDYWQMDVGAVARFLEGECDLRDGRCYNRKTGRCVRAVIPVHILGHPVEMDALLEIARRFELRVIEDATESLGAQYRGRAVGTHGLLACFSFNGNKIITTGGGGMLVTDDEELARRARYLTTQAKDDPVEYVHHEIGYNYRLTNVQAALGCAQLEQLPSFVERKREIAAFYREALADVPGLYHMREAPWARSAFWMYTVRVAAERFGCGSRELMRRLQEAGIQSRPVWLPLPRNPAHRAAAGAALPVADRLHRDLLSLPCSCSISDEDLARVAAAVRAAARP